MSSRAKGRDTGPKSTSRRCHREARGVLSPGGKHLSGACRLTVLSGEGPAGKNGNTNPTRPALLSSQARQQSMGRCSHELIWDSPKKKGGGAGHDTLLLRKEAAELNRLPLRAARLCRNGLGGERGRGKEGPTKLILAAFGTGGGGPRSPAELARGRRLPSCPSDVHLKLGIVPNCMFPVMIVQVVQIVYFYFGVLD